MIWSELMVQLVQTKLEDIDLHWSELQKNWTSVVDLIVVHFPYTERLELLKIGGDLTSFANYLADTHDLTIKEAMDAVDFVLLKKQNVPLERDKAA